MNKERTQRVLRVANFHDDSEIIAWDVITPVKDNWSAEEKLEYENLCENAIPILVNQYGEELGSDYEEILKEMTDTPELRARGIESVERIMRAKRKFIGMPG